MPDLVQATVKTRTSDLFRFMIFHAYSKVSGLITLVFSIVSLVMLPVSIFVWKDNFTTLAFAFIVVMYLILTPLNMFSQSRRQVLANPVFKNPITYHISDEIFEVQQYTGTVRLYWTQLLKVRKTPFDYLFYVNDGQAFILPKKSIESEELSLLEVILEKVKDDLAKAAPTIDKSQVKVKEEALDALEKQLMEMASKDAEKPDHDDEAIEVQEEVDIDHREKDNEKQEIELGEDHDEI